MITYSFFSSPQSVIAMVALCISKINRIIVLPRGTALCSEVFQSLQHVHSLLHFSENNMTTIQPGARNGRNEELRSVCIGSTVGHGQKTRTVMLQGEVLIRETVAIDRLASHAIAHGEVSSLQVNSIQK